MKDKFIIGLIVFSCLVILLLFNVNQSYSFDEAVHLSMAEGLYSGHGYGWVGKPNIDGFRPPGLPVLIYVFYLIFGTSELIGKMVIPIVSVSTVALLYYFLKRNVNKKFALFSSLFLVTNFMFLFFSLRVMSENLLMLLLFLDFVFFYESLKDKRYVVLLVLSLSVTFLVKYLAVSIIFGFAAYLLFLKRNKVRELLINRFLFLGMILGLLVLTPWFIYGINVYDSPLGAATHYTGWERLVNPLYSITRYGVVLPLLWGPLIPFGGYGLWRLLKEKKRNDILILTLFSIAALILSDGLASLLSLRYLEPLVVFLGIIAAYGVFVIKNEKLKYSFVGLCVLSLLIGYLFVFSYIIPQDFAQKIPDWVTRNSFFSEHNEYKNAALWLKEQTKENETIITDMYPFLWFYTKVNWMELPLHNETEFWDVVNQYDVRYVYIRPSHVPSFFDDSKTSLVLDKQFVKVYKINENL